MISRQIVAEGQYLAVFNSTHRVMKAESLLNAKGFQIKLIPAPKAVKTDCGLAIRFDPDILTDLMGLLEMEHLLPAFLCVMQDGSYTRIKEYET